MPWREVSVMDQRREFVRLAMQEGANRSGSLAGGSASTRTRGINGLADGKPTRNWRTDRALSFEPAANRSGD